RDRRPPARSSQVERRGRGGQPGTEPVLPCTEQALLGGFSQAGLEHIETKWFEHFDPAGKSGIGGLDACHDCIPLSLGQTFPERTKVDLTGPGAFRLFASTLSGSALGFTIPAGGFALLDLCLGACEVTRRLVVRPDRGNQVPGRILANSFVL